MKASLLALILVSTFSAFAAPKSAFIERNLKLALDNVLDVQVMQIQHEKAYPNLLYRFFLGCSDAQRTCIPGVKDYDLDLLISTELLGSLEYRCHLYSYPKKERIKMKVFNCIGIGHNVEFKSLNRGRDSVSF